MSVMSVAFDNALPQLAPGARAGCAWLRRRAVFRDLTNHNRIPNLRIGRCSHRLVSALADHGGSYQASFYVISSPCLIRG
jgi:hypothetical protein